MSDDDLIKKIFPLKIDKRPLIYDIVGKAREFIEELDINIEAKDLFEISGVYPNKTFLLEGPPGTGKTFCMNAYNNTKNMHLLQKMKEMNRNKKIFYDEFKVITFPYDIGRYGTAYINWGSKNMQFFFDYCISVANSGTNVIALMDEFDAIGSSRKSLREKGNNEDKKLLETLMTNLQIAHDTRGMYVVLMTNEPDSCDEAVLRAGRIDCRFKFDLPNENERKYAFKIAVNKINQRAKQKVICGTKYDNLVEISEGFSYADIFQSVDLGVRNKVKELFLQRAEVRKPVKINRNTLEKTIRAHKIAFKPHKKGIGF